MKIQRTDNTLRATTKTNLIYFGIALGVIMIAALLFFMGFSPKIRMGVAPGLALVGLWLVWSAFRQARDRIEMHDDSLTIRSRKGIQSVSKSNIDSITKRKGTGVVIQLVGGGEVIVPDLGNAQSVSNVLRAWLKK